MANRKRNIQMKFYVNIHALFRTQATEEETEDFPLILIQFGAATSHGLYGHSGDRRKAPSHGYGF